MYKIGVYAGSFDPITNGHIDIAKRASKFIDKLIVGVLNNPDKRCWFSPNERLNMAKNVLKDIKNIEVQQFDGLLVDFMKKNNSHLIIRGLRAVSDYEYELQISLINNTIADTSIETIFIPASRKNLYLSSSIVRAVAICDGNISNFVPESIIDIILKKEKKKE